MIVNLGSIEVDEATCRLIRRARFNIAGRATRAEVKDFALAAIAAEIETLEDLAHAGEVDEQSEPDDEEASVDDVIDLTDRRGSSPDLGEYLAVNQ